MTCSKLELELRLAVLYRLGGCVSGRKRRAGGTAAVVLSSRKKRRKRKYRGIQREGVEMDTWVVAEETEEEVVVVVGGLDDVASQSSLPSRPTRLVAPGHPRHSLSPRRLQYTITRSTIVSPS